MVTTTWGLPSSLFCWACAPVLPWVGGPLGTCLPPPGRSRLGAGRAPTGCMGHACLLQGKQKYTLPLYHAMMAGSPAARALAEETFAATTAQLHSNVVRYVQQILAPAGS